MFTAPQFLSRVRHRKECFILPAKLQCGQSRQKRFLVFACVLSRQGPGSVFDYIFSHSAAWNTWKQWGQRVIKNKWNGAERVKREKKLFKEVFCTFLFTVPQLLSCGRCRKDLLNPARRGTMQAVKRQEKRSPSLSAKDTGKG